ncbi:hypothetical protein IH779_00975 [Patescibacteria group bacterium]|nr:hypothetical protein [Patescibacteria group bacterium]
MELFNSSQFQDISSIIRIVFGLIFLSLFILVIFLLKGSSYLKLLFWQDIMEFFTFKPYGSKKIEKRWNKIKDRLNLSSESEHKLAIIEAESLLDDILKKIGFSGEVIGDRLKQITPLQLENIEEILEAHKIRNNIVHDPDYRLSLEEAKKAFEIYEKALINLEAL